MHLAFLSFFPFANRSGKQSFKNQALIAMIWLTSVCNGKKKNMGILPKGSDIIDFACGLE